MHGSLHPASRPSLSATTTCRIPPVFIDVHHHFNAPGGRSGQAGWSPQSTLVEMDAAGVEVAIGWPGPVVADDAMSARARARFLNDFGAGIVCRHPHLFGLFASLPPLADSEGALQEIKHALDELGADGIGLVTHYGERWLGDPSFKPVLAELNRRAAVVLGISAVKGLAGTGNVMVLVDVGNLAINPLIFKSLAFDPEKDLVPVALLFKAAFFVTVAADSPYKTFKDLQAAAANKARLLNYGSSAVGGPIHLGSARLD